MAEVVDVVEKKPSFFQESLADKYALKPEPAPEPPKAKEPEAAKPDEQKAKEPEAPKPEEKAEPPDPLSELYKEIGLAPEAKPAEKELPPIERFRQIMDTPEMRAYLAEMQRLQQPAPEKPQPASAPSADEIKQVAEVLGDEEAAKKLLAVIKSQVQPVQQVLTRAEHVQAIDRNMDAYAAQNPSFNKIRNDPDFAAAFAQKYGGLDATHPHFPEIVEAVYYRQNLKAMIKQAFERGRLSVGGVSVPKGKAAGTVPQEEPEKPFFEKSDWKGLF